MKVRNLLTGDTLSAELRTDSSASSYGHAVVTINGEPVDPIGIQIVEISDAEWDALPWQWAAALATDQERDA